MRAALMLLAALLLGVLIGALLPRPLAAREPSRPAIAPAAAMRGVAEALEADGPAVSAPGMPGPPLTRTSTAACGGCEPLSSPAAAGHRSRPVQPQSAPAAEPKSTLGPRVRPVEPRSGVATWFAAPAGTAAAGPALRRAIGKRWRGSLVDVCAGGRCVQVRLTDWCQCYRGTRRFTDYWAPTPGNAGAALATLLGWARQYPDAVWSVS